MVWRSKAQKRKRAQEAAAHNSQQKDRRTTAGPPPKRARVNGKKLDQIEEESSEESDTRSTKSGGSNGAESATSNESNGPASEADVPAPRPRSAAPSPESQRKLLPAVVVGFGDLQKELDRVKNEVLKQVPSKNIQQQIKSLKTQLCKKSDVAHSLQPSEDEAFLSVHPNPVRWNEPREGNESSSSGSSNVSRSSSPRLGLYIPGDGHGDDSTAEEVEPGAGSSNALAAPDKPTSTGNRAREHEEDLRLQIKQISMLVDEFEHMQVLWTSGAAVGARTWLKWCTSMEATASAARWHTSKLEMFRDSSP